MLLEAVASPPREGALRDVWLKDRRWDRIFIVGGALLVPVPILVFLLGRALGLSEAASEDVVTLLVMVAVGGPHVFATYTRTVLNPEFVKRETGWVLAGFAVVTVVAGAAVSSAFYDVRILGFPPMQLLLTFFFFWAGVHIAHQAAYCAFCYDRKRALASGVSAPTGRLWRALDYLVLFGCLYPVSFFRMSMANPADPEVARPDALATRIVLSLSGSREFTDAYPFRIGRVMPVLPDFMVSDAFWVLYASLFFVVLALFVYRSRREARAGVLNRPKTWLIGATAAVGLGVPVVPNLDSAFQGFNAWHSFQYLGLLWLMNRRSFEKGETQSAFVRRLSAAGAHRRFYAAALAATLGLLLALLAAGALLDLASGGRFPLFGHGPGSAPVDPESGAPLYRPGALLLAYYVFGFSLLLVHYLHDGLFFFRPRQIVDGSGLRI